MQNYKQLKCEIFKVLLKHVSDELAVFCQFVMTVPLTINFKKVINNKHGLLLNPPLH